MAAEFASDNKDYLESRLGRPVEGVDLYLAHFLGAGGAREFLGAHDANPDAPAAGILPAAARANRWVFYNRDGSPRSFAALRARLAAKLRVVELPVYPPAGAPLRAPPQFPPVPMHARKTAPATRTPPPPQHTTFS